MKKSTLFASFLVLLGAFGFWGGSWLLENYTGIKDPYKTVLEVIFIPSLLAFLPNLFQNWLVPWIDKKEASRDLLRMKNFYEAAANKTIVKTRTLVRSFTRVEQSIKDQIDKELEELEEDIDLLFLKYNGMIIASNFLKDKRIRRKLIRNIFNILPDNSNSKFYRKQIESDLNNFLVFLQYSLTEGDGRFLNLRKQQFSDLTGCLKDGLLESLENYENLYKEIATKIDMELEKKTERNYHIQSLLNEYIDDLLQQMRDYYR